MNNAYDWYQTLIKPTWAPPANLFGPVWTVLYILIAISFGVVFYKVWQKKLPKTTLLPFVLNLIFNFAFSPIQFGLQNNWLASLDIILVLGTLIWCIRIIRPHEPWIAYINIPYLLWVSFATTLQFTILWLNLK